MNICPYRKARTVLAVMCLGTILSSCTLLPSALTAQCDRIQPEVIRLIEPAPNSTVMLTTPFNLHIAWVFPREGGDGMGPLHLVKLVLDRQDVKLQGRGGSEDFPTSQATISYQSKESLAQGRHTAQVRWQSHLGKSYCFEWSFWVTTQNNPSGQ